MDFTRMVFRRNGSLSGVVKWSSISRPRNNLVPSGKMSIVRVEQKDGTFLYLNPERVVCVRTEPENTVRVYTMPDHFIRVGPFADPNQFAKILMGGGLCKTFCANKKCKHP